MSGLNQEDLQIIIALANDKLTAWINSLGAELTYLQDADGHDYLWTGDQAYSKGQSPVLFPIVGALNQGEMRFAGQTYRMPSHGFALRSEFTVF